jgi:hypothetical protein
MATNDDNNNAVPTSYCTILQQLLPLPLSCTVLMVWLVVVQGKSDASQREALLLCCLLQPNKRCDWLAGIQGISDFIGDYPRWHLIIAALCSHTTDCVVLLVAQRTTKHLVVGHPIQHRINTTITMVGGKTAQSSATKE